MELACICRVRRSGGASHVSFIEEDSLAPRIYRLMLSFHQAWASFKHFSGYSQREPGRPKSLFLQLAYVFLTPSCFNFSADSEIFLQSLEPPPR